MNKQIIYIPTKVEDDFSFIINKEVHHYLNGMCSINFHKDGKIIYKPHFFTETSQEYHELEHKIIARLDEKEAYVFTPEELKPLQDIVDEGYDPYNPYQHLVVQRWLKVIENLLNKEK